MHKLSQTHAMEFTSSLQIQIQIQPVMMLSTVGIYYLYMQPKNVDLIG